MATQTKGGEAEGSGDKGRRVPRLRDRPVLTCSSAIARLGLTYSSQHVFFHHDRMSHMLVLATLIAANAISTPGPLVGNSTLSSMPINVTIASSRPTAADPAHRRTNSTEASRRATQNAFEGQIVRWWECNMSNAQLWHVDFQERWVFSGKIHPRGRRDLCLDPAGGTSGDRDGQPMRLWRCLPGGDNVHVFHIGDWNSRECW
ncbi:hypothetical protein BCR44DRAFT_1425651 [Catenaria anguillulae PL171]|uniref:Uncharacterized protein n=1 Tax=Catenaria anguillulae PL171 TaxID=765915 RepID=A0A1Y2I1F8_9FUNG|nr:hypothetical protein BCR44DRAFT_1425651 [Catenaria anguillulae PL171]